MSFTAANRQRSERGRKKQTLPTPAKPANVAPHALRPRRGRNPYTLATPGHDNRTHFAAWLHSLGGRYTVPAWAAETIGVTRSAITKAVARGWVRTARYTLAGGTEIVLVNLDDCALRIG